MPGANRIDLGNVVLEQVAAKPTHALGHGVVIGDARASGDGAADGRLRLLAAEIARPFVERQVVDETLHRDRAVRVRDVNANRIRVRIDADQQRRDFSAAAVAAFDGLRELLQALEQGPGGPRSDSSITLGMSYDTRDSVLLTRKGEHVDFSAEFAGGPLLGQTNIYKFQADAQHYTLLPYDMILTLAGATGVVDYYDSSTEVPLFDRFFIGGSRSVRGFSNRNIGPIDNNGVPLGGDTMAYANVEVTFPIMDRVRGAIFTDAGFLDARPFHYQDAYNELDAAAGVGLRLNLPIGPLRLDYGIPYKDQGYNHSTGKFSFDVGYQF